MEAGTVECKQGEIQREFVRLSERKETLHDRVGILVDKLKDILSKPQDTNDVTGMPLQALTSPMAIDLSAVSAVLESDIEKIDETIRRLEL